MLRAMGVSDIEHKSRAPELRYLSMIRVLVRLPGTEVVHARRPDVRGAICELEPFSVITASWEGDDMTEITCACCRERLGI